MARGDTFLYFYPYWQAAASRLTIEHIPLWNPDLFMGAPFLANSQVGLLYPLNWPLWYLFDTPYAVTAAIILHLSIAAVGAYFASRGCLRLDRHSAFISAILFSLGGYLTAQVEHINQLQGLAWLPWFFAVYGKQRQDLTSVKDIARLAGYWGLLFSLQLLAGHTQTTFITVVGLSLWIAMDWVLIPILKPRSAYQGRFVLTGALRSLSYRLLPLVLGGVLAALLAAVQLLPTMELARLSARQGGLPANEVLSFSLNPLLISRTILPGYGESLFTEYIAWLPISAILLGFYGVVLRWRKSGVTNALLLVIAGLFLAFGLFNPIYQLLARLPVFNLFRVPARWLALYALGMGFLAGAGWQGITDRYRLKDSDNGKNLMASLFILGFLIIVGLIFSSFLSVPLSKIFPLGDEVTAQRPGPISVASWSAELVIVGLLLLFGFKIRKLRPIIYSVFLLMLLVCVLWASSRSLPFNIPTTPESYFDLRPPIARLKSNSSCNKKTEDCAAPPERLLSLSEIFFDVGDQPEIDTIYRDQLSTEARYDYTIAIKQKEVLAPNLPMAYGLQSVDGFDGGILPLQSYTMFSRLLLDNGEESVDGRLREYLDGVPQARWLDLLNVGYLITDKVGDVWRDEVFFDLQHPVTIDSTNRQVAVGYVPDSEATELRMIASGRSGLVFIESAEGKSIVITGELMDNGLLRYPFPSSLTPQTIELRYRDGRDESGGEDTWFVNGLSLVDGRDGSFWTLVLGNYRLIHSGDVKIYQNMDVLPRAFLVSNWTYKPSLEDSLSMLALNEFDPGKMAVVIGEGQSRTTRAGQGEILFKRYESDRVVLQTESEAETLLILTDAYYPGWNASLDGDVTPILQTDILFRGIVVPAGKHEVAFSYEPAGYEIGRWLGLAGFFLLLGLLAYGHHHPKNDNGKSQAL